MKHEIGIRTGFSCRKMLAEKMGFTVTYGRYCGRPAKQSLEGLPRGDMDDHLEIAWLAIQA